MEKKKVDKNIQFLKILSVNRSRLIYYVGFPALMIVLCGFSYYLGFNRGAQSIKTSKTQNPTPSEGVHEPTEDLTFFKTLKEDVPASNPKKEVAEKPTPKVSAAPKTKPAPKAVASKGDFVIQVSAFKDIGRAHELIDVLKNKGFQAFGQHRRRGTQEFYRVYVGPFLAKTDAEKEGRRLSSAGFPDHFLTKAPKK